MEPSSKQGAEFLIKKQITKLAIQMVEDYISIKLLILLFLFLFPAGILNLASVLKEILFLKRLFILQFFKEVVILKHFSLIRKISIQCVLQRKQFMHSCQPTYEL